MTQQTALDEFVGRVKEDWGSYGKGYDDWNIEGAVEYFRDEWPEWVQWCLSVIPQDPRYLAYCKEQDRKEGKRLDLSKFAKPPGPPRRFGKLYLGG